MIEQLNALTAKVCEATQSQGELRKDLEDRGLLDARAENSQAGPEGARERVPPASRSNARASGWTGSVSDQPLRELKLKELPKLGKGKGELPYGKWRVDVEAQVDASGVEWVLTDDFPAGSDSEAFRFKQANSVVFAALLVAVRDLPVLGDQIRRLRGGENSARDAWQKIKSHFVRLANTNHTFMLKRLQEFEPRETESMESFLNRGYQLRDDFMSYNLELEDKLLITQVFSKLSYQWKLTAGLSDSGEGKTWEEVAEALQAQDNARRQSNMKAADALFPLGWTRRSSGEGQAKKAGSPPGAKKEGAGGNQPKPAEGGKKKWNPGKSPRGPLVCFHCKGEHVWRKCPNLPEGWKPSEEDREKAYALQNKRGKAARDKGGAWAAYGEAQDEGPDPSTDGFCNGVL